MSNKKIKVIFPSNLHIWLQDRLMNGEEGCAAGRLTGRGSGWAVCAPGGGNLGRGSVGQAAAESCCTSYLSMQQKRDEKV